MYNVNINISERTKRHQYSHDRVLSSVVVSSRKKIKRKYWASVQVDLANIYRVFHLTVAEYTLFSSILSTFSKLYVSAQASLNKFIVP